MKELFFAALVFASLLTFISLARALWSETVADRLVAVNIITSKVILVIVLLSLFSPGWYFLDVAIVYALCSFTATIAILKSRIEKRLDSE